MRSDWGVEDILGCATERCEWGSPPKADGQAAKRQPRAGGPARPEGVECGVQQASASWGPGKVQSGGVKVRPLCNGRRQVRMAVAWAGAGDG